jgi:hypothetical protein
MLYMLDNNNEPIDLESKIEELWWQKRGLMYTATGYGSKIPTSYKVKYNNRWYRVYCRIYSNSGTCYIITKGKKIIIHGSI